MATQGRDLWSLVLDQPYIDPMDLAEAIQKELDRGPADYRTRLLIRDSCHALAQHWGETRLAAWRKVSRHPDELESILREDLGETGFPYLASQIVELTRPETIREFLRELSTHLHRPVRLALGDSGSLILRDLLSRQTQDVDVVDEVPAEIRGLHSVLRRLQERYRLQLTHFQSHYLPRGWEQRVQSLEPFGPLQVDLVDAYDVFLSKLFSRREKDRDDLRVLAPQLDRTEIERRLQADAGALDALADLHQNAKDNWFILYGEAFPS